jgi:hypothetical protein
MAGSLVARTAPPELGLDHREGGLDVPPLVVIGEERLALVGEQVVHALPRAVAGAALNFPRQGSGSSD